MNNNPFDLLTTVTYGGCSAKIPQGELSKLLANLPLLKDKNVLVDIETHDDAGVYRINDELALIVTTDFFPPICSDPYEFGEIAACNSLSDVYAMGGTPLLVLNLVMFPATTLPLTILQQILEGGHSKIAEAGAFVMGGHTIDDATPKYGLAVVGTVHPNKITTNAGVRVGEKLILTKPLGTGTLIAGRRMNLCTDAQYQAAIEQMKLLNKMGCTLMQRYHVTGATDVTGFGLLGHALKMAQASGVSLQLSLGQLPILDGVMELLSMGAVPGAALRNLEYVKPYTHTDSTLPLEYRLAACDAQTSGGLLMAVAADKADEVVELLRTTTPHTHACIIGEAIAPRPYALYLS